MNKSLFTLTLEFRDSARYRRFVFRLRRLNSLRNPTIGVLQGTARIYVKRNLRLREVTLLSHGHMLDILFDLRQIIDPDTVFLRDFSMPVSKDVFAVEFQRCLHACIESCVVCFDHPSDPESFHRFRLAIRAFRSFLKIAQKIGIEGLADLRETTSFIAKISNDLRDADVRFGLYQKFNEPVPALFLKARDELLYNAIQQLKETASETWFSALRYVALTQSADKFKDQFFDHIDTQTKEVAKSWRKLDMHDDAAVHALRIRMKQLSYGYSFLSEKDGEMTETAKSIKAIQSRLGDVRDLRGFYRLPGLDQETRYRAVQKLSSLERELKELGIK